MLNILYIGPNESEWAQQNCPGSLAAAKWSRGFQTALAKVCNLTTLSHTYMYPWPKGRKIWVAYDKRYYPSGWDCVSIQYPALRYVRELWWDMAYPAKARKIAQEKNVDATIFYNCHFPYLLRTMKALHGIGVPCFPIILDGDDPRKDDWGWIKRAGQYSRGIVSLSWWVHENCPVNVPKYHMDGGADSWRGRNVICGDHKTQSTKHYTLVHTGALDQWRGLDFMIDVVKALSARRQDVKFIFCGKSSCRTLEKVFGDNKQVELPGFVAEEEMERICNSADVLLNVRDPKHPDNILNYPSKLPHYLSFGRPVVSTRLESLSPDYGEVVEFPSENTVDGFVRKVEEVMAWSADEKSRKYDVIRNWFEKRKKWDVLAEGLERWISGVILKTDR